jgi:hypothetical protein
MRALLVVLAACGRVGFDAVPPSGTSDANADAQTAFCASQSGLVFCDDFDEGGGTAQWDLAHQSSGSFTVDGAESFSASSSLLVQTDALGSGEQASVYIAKTAFSSYNHVLATFAVRFASGATGEPVFGILAFDDGSHGHRIEIVERPAPADVYIEDIDTPSGSTPAYQYYNTNMVMPVDSWHTVAIDYTGGANASLALTVDGASFLSRAPIYTSAGQFQLFIGMPFLSDPATPWSARFDNVTVSAQ